jgi:hypothetical protein
MKRTRFLFLAIVMGLIAAACSSGPSAEQLDATAQLADAISDLSASLDSTSAEVGALNTGLDATEEAISGFVTSGQAQAIDRTAGIPDPPEGQVAVRLSFAYQPTALPGNGLQIYEPLPDVSTVWAMESLEAGQDLPVGNALADQTLFITPGEKQSVTLAYENPTEAAIRFMAVPHQDSPGALNGMIWPQCLCFSFPYEAPAQGGWYRVIELTASPDIPAGSKVDMLWTMLTDESVFPLD